MLRHGLGLAAMGLVTLLLTGCPGETGTGPDGGSPDGGPACTHTCSQVGATRCDGSVVEGCAIDADGCLKWMAGVDCSDSQTICDDASGAAMCVAPEGSCSDGTKNQDETDGACERDADCQSGTCDVGRTNTCIDAPAACTDGQKNGAETDVDCGGPDCPACADGKACADNDDCQSGYCDLANTGTCGVPAPACDDGTKNGDESDVDCGGACPGCMVGQACGKDADCASGNCDVGASNVCLAAASCNDGMQNQDETGVDCGGMTCSPCPDGEGCQQASDCQSGNCDVGGSDACVPAGQPTCTDGVQNQDETDVDCGGATCGPCAEGQACQRHADCSTGACDLLQTQTCVPLDPRYQVNEDFETGDFSRFPYQFASTQGNDWVIETDPANCHMGRYCARTNPAHAENEVSSFSVSLSVRQDTTVTFWAKVNTEPNEHFFRFYIDGVEQVAVSGQVDWTLYSFPVPATGAGGPNRVLTWAYSRSAYIDPNHVPWNEVWIDDIDMPDWNTEPTVPEVVRPWNGTLTTDRTPTFEWQSFDPDFDVITYEMQYDTDPNFSLPTSTGETNDTQFTPQTDLQDGQIYYWRVRAKDDSNYRWSAWSGPWSVKVDSTFEYAAIWRQESAAQFQMDDLTNVEVLPGGQVKPMPAPVSEAASGSSPTRGASWSHTFTGLPSARSGTSATLTVAVDADVDQSTEYFQVYIEGDYLGTVGSTGQCQDFKTFTIPDISPYLADRQVEVTLTSTTQVDPGGCSRAGETVDATLEYLGEGTGSLVSTPIDFSTFQGRSTWEKVQVEGTGEIRIRVLDASGTPIDDAIVPGNAAGQDRRTIHLWDLEPVDYPVIRLEAELLDGATLDAWQVVGNDVYEWRFSHDGDAEGWIGVDRMATPTVTVGGGVLRYETQAAGDDPRIEYWFDQPVDASRFTTLEVRLRTSNTYNNDDVTLYWQSNYGFFDARRSFTHRDVYLFDMQDLSFDLTVVPMPPNEPWRGQIEAIRIDPVVDFYDQLGMPSDGWLEIDRIALY